MGVAPACSADLWPVFAGQGQRYRAKPGITFQRDPEGLARRG